MSEFPWAPVFTLVGVVVGFSLSQVAEVIKSEKTKRTIKKALINELSVIKENLLYAVNHENNLPKDRLPIVTEIYDTSKHKLVSILKPNQLLTIQKTYAQIKQVGMPMKSGKTLFRGYMELLGENVIYQHDLNDEITLLEKAIAELN